MEHTSTDSEPTLLFEWQGGVATLTLNRPEARNALTTGPSRAPLGS
jgi:enoyl-CoA hydratase/carnithine racemase